MVCFCCLFIYRKRGNENEMRCPRAAGGPARPEPPRVQPGDGPDPGRAYKDMPPIGDQEVSRMPRKKRGRPAKRPVGRIDVKLPRGLIEEIDKLVEQKLYLTKADFVRSAVREKLLPSGTVAQRQPKNE